MEALKILLNETNPLYQSLKSKFENYPELRRICHEFLFTGKRIPYMVMNDYIEIAAMLITKEGRNGFLII